MTEEKETQEHNMTINITPVELIVLKSQLAKIGPAKFSLVMIHLLRDYVVRANDMYKPETALQMIQDSEKLVDALLKYFSDITDGGVVHLESMTMTKVVKEEGKEDVREEL